MSRGATEIGYLCHHGHYCFYADPDEGGQCGSKRVGTVTLSFDDTDALTDWTEIVAEAQASLAEKYETWRKCDCEAFPSKESVLRENQRNIGLLRGAHERERTYLDRAEAAESERDAVTATLRQAEAKIVELVQYGEKRYAQWQAVEALLNSPKPNATDPDFMCPNCVTPWKCNGPHLTEECPRCFKPVEHQDDHLVGDRDINAWFECPED